jgi:hypothetical protein
MAVTWKAESASANKRFPDVMEVSTTWDAVCGLKEHPLHDELVRYLAWKKGVSKPE